MKKITKVLSLAALIGGVVVGTTSCSKKVNDVDDVAKVLAKSIDATQEKLENLSDQKGFSLSFTESENYDLKRTLAADNKVESETNMKSSAKVQASFNMEAFRKIRDAAAKKEDQPKAADLFQAYVKAEAEGFTTDEDGTSSGNATIEGGFANGVGGVKYSVTSDGEKEPEVKYGVKADLNTILYTVANAKVMYDAMLSSYGVTVDEVLNFDTAVETIVKSEELNETLDEVKTILYWVAGEKTTSEFVDYINEQTDSHPTDEFKTYEVKYLDLIKSVIDSFVDISGSESAIKFSVSDEKIAAGLDDLGTKLAAQDEAAREFALDAFGLEIEGDDFAASYKALTDEIKAELPNFSATATIKFSGNVISGLKFNGNIDGVVDKSYTSDDSLYSTTSISADASAELSFKFATSKVTAFSTKDFDEKDFFDANAIFSGSLIEIPEITLD